MAHGFQIFNAANGIRMFQNKILTLSQPKKLNTMQKNQDLTEE